MQVFDIDTDAARTQFGQRGWVYLPAAMTPEFLADLERACTVSIATAKLPERAIKGKKEQALYTLPDALDWRAELLAPIATVCELDADALTLSERHIQVYDANADPRPRPHKDRFGSQISIGFSVHIPKASRLVLWPDVERETNENDRAVYRDEWPVAEPVAIADEPGGVVMFAGSSTWHARCAAAGAVNLYVKVNEFGSDPLGEDPRSVVHEGI